MLEDSFWPLREVLRLLYTDPQLANLFMGVTSLSVGIPVSGLFAWHVFLVRTAQSTIEYAARARAAQKKAAKGTKELGATPLGTAAALQEEHPEHHAAREIEQAHQI